MSLIRPIAIYLPQFHPTPENDAWWGKGFTEWTNVAKAKPLFKGHHQPRLPADLGFYDLRLAEARLSQEKLAKEYGLHGFCYYHYWFKGKRLLQVPLDRKLANADEDFPFMLCWANETWSRRWLGEEQEILIKQEYSAADDVAHANYLANVFGDKRYITHNKRPVFTIYRPNDLPDISATIDTIKSVALKENGIEPFLVASNSHSMDDYSLLLKKGFDGILNFRPQLGVLPNVFKDVFLKNRLADNILKHQVFSGTHKVYDYRQALELMQKVEPEDFNNIIPSVFVGWDNTARRGNKGIMILNNHPALFEAELKRVITKLQQVEQNIGIVFINAWNEWAEGNYLEPDNLNKHAYLQAVKNIVDRL